MQRFSFVELFIDLFENAVHVSGENLAHFQEHFWLYIQIWYSAPVGSNIGALYQSSIYTVKGAPESGRVCRPKHVEQIQIDQ